MVWEKEILKMPLNRLFPSQLPWRAFGGNDNVHFVNKMIQEYESFFDRCLLDLFAADNWMLALTLKPMYRIPSSLIVFWCGNFNYPRLYTAMIPIISFHWHKCSRIGNSDIVSTRISQHLKFYRKTFSAPEQEIGYLHTLNNIPSPRIKKLGFLLRSAC